MSNQIDVVLLGLPGLAGPGSLATVVPDVTPSASPYQAQASTYVPVDCRTGSVTVQTPLNPTDGQLFVVSDVWGKSGTNSIAIVAQGIGVTVGDPSWTGTGSAYVATGHIAVTVLTAVRWRYAGASQQWRIT